MTNTQDRKEYRKNLMSTGQIRLAGEIINLKSYDVSVNGIMVEIFPGKFLSRFEDFEALQVENTVVEIFIQDLMLTGDAEIIWIKEDQGKILLGLEYRDVQYNAQKLWLKRLCYRKNQVFSGTIMLKEKQVEIQGINISLDGMSVTGKIKNDEIKVGNVFILKIEGMAVSKVLAKVLWINREGEEDAILGLRCFELDQ